MSMVKAKAGPVTLLVMAVCVVIYGLQMIGFGRGVFAAMHFPAFEGQQWQLWRWLSHALLHFSATHIIFNLLWWWQLVVTLNVASVRKTTASFLSFLPPCLARGNFMLKGRILADYQASCTRCSVICGSWVIAYRILD